MSNDLLPGELNAKSDVDSGEYEKHSSLDGVVVDLGGHVGYFTERASRDAELVVSLELDRENFRRLEGRCVGLNVERYNFGAWDGYCLGHVERNEGNSGAHQVREGRGDNSLTRVLLVDTGDFLKMITKRVDFVKVDIEGSEGRAIRSILKAGFRPYFAMEIHSEELYAECRGMLEGAGYEWVDGGNKVGVHWANYPIDRNGDGKEGKAAS